MYPVPFHSRMIYFYPRVSDSSYHVHCCPQPRHSHPVRSEPRGPSLWLSCRHRRRPWRARTASSSPRCTGERRFSATAPPSWPAVWTCGEEESLSHAQRVRRVRALVDCDEWARCRRGKNNNLFSVVTKTADTFSSLSDVQYVSEKGNKRLVSLWIQWELICRGAKARLDKRGEIFSFSIFLTWRNL